MAKESKAFGSQRAKKAHLLLGSGGLSAEISDLRDDVEEGFQNMEERDGYPEVYYSGPPLVAGGDITLTGVNLLQGQTFDTLTIAQGAASVALHAMKPGDSGITVVIAVGVGAAVAYNTSTKVLTITVVVGGTSDDAIATLINANSAQTDGYIRAVSAGGGNFSASQASQPMTGGVGDYAGNKVVCAGYECLPSNTAGTTAAAKWTDTSVTVTVPAIAAAASKVMQLSLTSDGTRADVLAFQELTALLASLPWITGGPELNWIDGGAPAAAGGDIVLRGTSLLQSQTFDSIHITETTADLFIEMLKPGVSGFTVEVVAGVGALSVAVAGSKLTITLAAGGSTVSAIATAINANAADTDGIMRANEDVAGSITLDQADTALAGGAGDYANNTVLVSGAACLPANETGATTTAKWTDTTVTVTVPALTGLSPARAAGDIAKVVLVSNAVRSPAIAAALA